ncbi:MAG: TlpA disulfide reductase family protein [Gammaproteobacteria bacterium]|nr:TlpA disulfide reductase family protein [Gammaproteobacteria bacterium]
MHSTLKLLIMRRREIWILGLLVFGVATVALHSYVKSSYALTVGSVARMGNIAVGEPASDFSLLDINGRRVELSQFRDRKVVVLQFWTSWCSTCDESLEQFQSLNHWLSDRGIEFLAVNVGENPQTVREKIDDLSEKTERRFKEPVPWVPFSFGVLTDPAAEVRTRFRLPGVPVLAIVGMDGRIEHIESGYPPRGRLRWRNRSNRLERVSDKLKSLTTPAEDPGGRRNP